MRTLDAAGLTLVPQLPAHAEAMFAVLADLALQPFGSAAPASLDALRQRFARLAQGWSPDGRQQWLNWVVMLPDGNLAGYVQATIGPDRCASIGYELAPAHWGRGIGTQAAALMIDELVAHYRIQGLHASLHPDNHRSMRLLLRLGFVPLRADLLAAGQSVPVHDEGDCVMVCPLPWRRPGRG
jgi:[ribosomal protein S5]-alanine N-acetyltransferase